MKPHWKISNHHRLSSSSFTELWMYRYLLVRYIRKDLELYYRQTLLGPLWFFIQPALSTLVYTFVFAHMSRIPTDATPPILFYLSGLTVWNYFSECFSKTCTVLRDHAATFSKLYFPRLIVPLSIIISNLAKFAIQLLLFIIVLAGYWLSGYAPSCTSTILLFPLLILLMGMLGLGMGLIVSSLTVRYRDLAFLVSFGTQLLMFLTPVIYPLSSVPAFARVAILLNPITAIIETFRHSFLGAGAFSPASLAYASVFIITILSVGLMLYHKIERNFIDHI